jgi:molybdate transport system ATP-binding protein
MTIQARFHHHYDTFLLDVNLQAPGEGVTALIGPSGCGKTSLLRAIAGLDKLDGGYLKIGNDVWQDDQVWLPIHERALGFVFQDAKLFSHLSVSGNLRYGLKRTPPERHTVRYDDVVSLLGLEKLLERGTEDLSGGEKQRVAMGRTLLSGPQLLLMDEPMASLDAESKSAIMPYLTAVLNELNLPVLYVSHLADEVARLADHLVIMADGCIIETGLIGDMLTRLDLPLSHRADAEALVVAEAVGHDNDDQLTELKFDGGRILVTGTELKLGQAVRVRIQARDVSLTLKPQTGTSILNVLPSVITEIVAEDEAQYLVRLDCGGTPLLARVSRRSARKLELRVGLKVCAQVKSVAVLS